MASSDAREGVPREALRMIDAWTTVPAFIRDRYLTIVASNSLARAISPIFHEGVNLARLAFSAEEIPRRSTIVPQQIADELMESVTRYEWDANFEEMVDELSGSSPAFIRAWKTASPSIEPTPFDVLHDRVGPLSLTSQAMTMPIRSDLSLVVLSGTGLSSRAALRRLAEITDIDRD